jgi:hypothetical protein
VSENLIQPMIRDLVFLSPLHPTLGAPERRNLGTDVLAPISFLPRWDDAAQCQAFDLIRGLIEILVPFSSADRHLRRPSVTDPSHTAAAVVSGKDFSSVIGSVSTCSAGG